MNAKQFLAKMHKMAAKEDDFFDLTTVNPRYTVENIGTMTGNLGSCNHNWTDNSYHGTSTGINPWQIGGSTPYIGDPIFPTPSPSYPPQPVSYPPISPIPQIVTVTNTSGTGLFNDLFMEFFNVQRLLVDATCAVTHEKIPAGEPVLILEENIISKKAFMKMLMKQFARMMVPEVEEMAEIYDYDK